MIDWLDSREIVRPEWSTPLFASSVLTLIERDEAGGFVRAESAAVRHALFEVRLLSEILVAGTEAQASRDHSRLVRERLAAGDRIETPRRLAA